MNHVVSVTKIMNYWRSWCHCGWYEFFEGRGARGKAHAAAQDHIIAPNTEK